MNATYQNDIPLSLAVAAHSGSSFVPETRGASEREGYAQTLAADLATLTQHATKGGTLAELDAEFERFREGYGKRYRAYLASRSRCMSTMITGASNFPVRRMEKRNDIAHKRLNELIEYRERAIKAAIRNLRPDLRPIMSGDADACERLREELTTLEARQARMAAVNKAHARYVKNPATLETSSLDEKACALIRGYVPQYSWEPHPFAPYQLSNNNANIRRVRERLAALESAKATPAAEVKGEAATVEDDPPANRVRLFFPGKPPADVRETLKRGGFRWAPSIGAWQAYRHDHTIALARKVAQVAA